MIETKDSFFQFKKVEKTVSNIRDFKVSEDNTQATFKIQNFNQDTRVHVFNATFQEEGQNFNSMASHLQLRRLPPSTVEKTKEEVESNFIDEYKLPAELLYAIRRK